MILNFIDLAWIIDGSDYSRVDVPVLLVANTQDPSVNYPEMLVKFRLFKSATKHFVCLENVTKHVLAGRILGPDNTDVFAKMVANFVTLTSDAVRSDGGTMALEGASLATRVKGD